MYRFLGQGALKDDAWGRDGDHRVAGRTDPPGVIERAGRAYRGIETGNLDFPGIRIKL